MSSPLIVPLRDIPKTEMHIPSNDEEEIENSGFPFDDQDFDRGRSHHSSFRSQLDDLARRHPEFAQHLNIGDDFPLRAHTLGRHRRGSDTEKPSGSQDAEFGRRHAYDRPFPRFEHFDSPFRKYFEQDTPDFYDLPHHHQVRHGYPDDLSEEPRQHPQQHHHHSQQQEQKSQPSSPQPSNADKPPLVPQNREGGRKQNIQQSNTVDLGQKQQPVDENRGQRSMSAPPENRSTGQRFVTSINIPIQRTGGATGGGDMGNKAATQAQDHSSQQQQQQQQQSSKPNERVIPIHVEGRDEPIIPKNATFSQAPPPQPQTERLFGKNPGHFTQFLNKGEPHGMNPEDYYRQQQQQFQKQQQEFHPQHFPQQQQSQSQTQAPPPPPSAPQSTSQQAQPEQQAQAPPPPQPIKLTQLDQIQSIQKDVSELMNQVEIFNGKPKDKQYLYLDEMLTRNLIKLDNIETEGKDNIRQARKEAIKCIEGCIGILEAKANANLAAEIQKQQGSADQKMEVVATAEVGESKENAQQQQVESLPSTATTNEDSKSSTVLAEQPKDATETTASLEVSGVSRTGSVVNVTPMEVNESESKKEVPVPTPNIETQAEENKKEQSALPTDPQQKPEENKDAEDVKKAEDATKTEGAAAAPENVGVSTGTTENTTAEAAASQSTEKDTASGEDKKEKKKGKKKEKSDNKK